MASSKIGGTSSFSVNGHPLPVEPKSASITYQDLDGESERNANGYLVRQILRRDVVKIELEFGPIYSETAFELLRMFDDEERTFEFTYPDPLTNDIATITAYCGDRQLGYMRTQIGKVATSQATFSGSTVRHLYDGLRISIIEY